MSLAVRAVSVKKGVDPRETAMIAFGGAGPLHAVAIAREIFIPKVIVPKVPGTFSALGMLMASWRQDFVRTLYGLLGALDADAGRGACSPSCAEAGQAPARARRHRAGHRRLRLSRRPALRRPGAHHRDSGARRRACSAATSRRCARRSTPSTTSATARPRPTSGWRSSMCGWSSPRARTDTLAERWLSEPWTPEPPVADQWRDGDLRRCGTPARRRASSGGRRLPAGAEVEGPAVIEEPNATTLIHPGDVATVSDAGHLIIDVAEHDLATTRSPIRSPSRSCATPSSPMPTRWRTRCRKAAYNMMIYEVRDYCCGLIDTQARMISQNRGGLPIFLADLGVAVADGIARYGLDGFAPGDVIDHEPGRGLRPAPQQRGGLFALLPRRRAGRLRRQPRALGRHRRRARRASAPTARATSTPKACRCAR